MKQIRCPHCRSLSHIETTNYQGYPMYICGSCGDVWQYDNLLFKEFKPYEVGRFLEKSLGQGRKYVQRQTKEESKDNEISMSMPKAWQQKT